MMRDGFEPSDLRPSVVAQPTFLVGLFLLGRRFVRSRKSPGSAGQISIDASGMVTIPVFATFTGLRGVSPWLALATNSLNPRLAVASDGLHYRVIGERTAAFSLVHSVEVRRGPGTVNLCFIFNEAPSPFQPTSAMTRRLFRLLDPCRHQSLNALMRARPLSGGSTSAS